MSPLFGSAWTLRSGLSFFRHPHPMTRFLPIIARIVLALLFVSSTSSLHAQTTEADSLHAAGIALYTDGDVAASVATLEQAIRQFDRSNPTDSTELGYAEIVDDLGYILTDQGDYPAAQARLEEALDIRQRHSHPDSIDIGDTQENLARLYLHWDKLEKAQEWYQLSDQAYANYLGNPSTDYAGYKNRQALEYFRKELYEDALRNFKEAEQAIAAASVGSPDHLTIAGNVATALENLERYDQSMKQHIKVVEIGETYSDTTTMVFADVLYHAGRVGILVGDPDADRYLRRCINVYKHKYGQSVDLGNIFYSVAKLYEGAEMHSEAAGYFSEALPVFEHDPGKISPDYALSLAGVALAQHNIPDNRAAFTSYRQLIPIVVAVFDSSQADYKVIRDNMVGSASAFGDMLTAEENWDQLVEMYQAAREMEEMLYGNMSDQYSNLSYNLGTAYLAAADTTAGLKELRTSLEIEVHNRGETHPEVAFVAARVGEVLTEAKDFPEADNYIQQALDIYRDSPDNQEEYVSTLYKMVLLRFAEKRYDEALEISRELVAKSKEVSGESHINHAAYVSVEAKLMFRTGLQEPAVTKFDEAIELERRHRQNAPERLIEYLNEGGDLLFYLEEHERSLPYYQESVALASDSARFQSDYLHATSRLKEAFTILGRNDDIISLTESKILYLQKYGDNQSVAWSMVDLAVALRNSRVFDKAEDAVLKARRLLENEFGERSLYSISTYAAHATIMQESGRYSDAQELLDEAIPVIDAIPQDSLSEMQLVALEVFGSTLYYNGRYNRALRYFEKAMAIRSRYRDANSIERYQFSRDFLTVMQTDMGRDRKVQLALEALEEKKRDFPESHPAISAILELVAVNYAAISELVKAEEYLDLAEASRKGNPETTDADYLDIRLWRTTIGMIKEVNGERSPAAFSRFYNEYRSIVDAYKETDKTDRLRIALNFLSATARYSGDEVAYVRTLEEVVETLEKDNDPDDPLAIITAMANLAPAYVTTGQNDRADSTATAAAEMARNVLGEGHANTAEVFDKAGAVFLQTGSLDAAEAILFKADSITAITHGAESIQRKDVLVNLAQVYLARGESDRAENSISRLAAIASKSLQASFLTATEEALYALASSSAETRLPVELALIDNDKTDYAYEYLMAYKGIVTRTIASRNRGLRAASQDRNLELAIDDLRDSKQELANLQLRPVSPQKATSVQSLKQKIATLQSQLAASMEFNVSDVSVEELHRSMDGLSIIVEFAKIIRPNISGKYEERERRMHYVAFVVSKNQPTRLVNLGRAARIDDLIAEYTETLDYARQDFARGDDEQDLEDVIVDIGAELYKELFAGIAEFLEPGVKLFIAADGELNRIPMGALVDDDGRYLIESHQISYLTSGRDLIENTNASGTGTVVFAGPDYDLDVVDHEPTDNSTNETGLVLRGPTQTSVRGMKWDPLAGALLEAADITSALQESSLGPVTTFTDTLALETTFKNVSNPEILHLATHGYFLPGGTTGDVDELGGDATSADVSSGAAVGLGLLRQASNPLLRSGIILAGANNIGNQERKSVEDGWVTAEEITQMDLAGTRLVVLSACESGLGDIKSGQSVRGLRQAFQVAGAQNLVSSLYLVPDQETREAMQHFYAGLSSGNDVGQALHEAQLKLIQDRRAEHGAAHPFFWASLIHVGTD